MVKEKPRQYKAELESFKSFTHRVRDLVEMKKVSVSEAAKQCGMPQTTFFERARAYEKSTL